MNRSGFGLCWFVAVAAMALAVAPAALAASPVQVAVGDGTARVTHLAGRADAIQAGTGQRLHLTLGDELAQGDRVITGTGGRIELKLPDGSFVRFDERTTFELVDMGFDANRHKRDVRISVIVGKTWAKVARLFGSRDSRFEMATPTAVAGVRGTTYRMNVNDDSSAVVKVYDGEVAVSQREEAQQAGDTAKHPYALKAPTPVAGPHPVTMEQWVYIVGALQQININADGTAAKPFRFDIMADLNEWVKWNQLRDQEIEGADR